MPLRKVSRCHEDLVQIIYKVADKLNLRDIDYVTELGHEDIDIFVSGIYKVYIKGTRDGARVKFTVLIKWYGDPRKRAYLRELYHREYIFYQQITPELLDIQRRFEVIKGLKLKFYDPILGSVEHGQEFMAFLPDKRFRLYLDRFQMIDVNHAALVMKNFAKLHGLSFAFQKTKPSLFEKIKDDYGKDVQYSNLEYISKSVKCYFSMSVNVVSDSVAKEKLQALVPNVLNVLSKSTEFVKSYSVFCHGDCWNNNITVSYTGGRPVDLMFIDYQLWRLASPVTDISYFLYMVAEKDFLAEHFDRLIEIYYGTLVAVLRECKLDIKDIYPRDVFDRHLKLYSVLGLIEALVSMKIITAHVEEAVKITEMKYGAENGLSENASQDQLRYAERVNGVVNDFFEREFSLDCLLKM